MREDETQFTMRMNNSVYERLKKRAERNKRSIAKELEYITEQAIQADEVKLDELVKNIFTAYENENDKYINLKQLINDKNTQSPLKAAALELLDFVQNLK